MFETAYTTATAFTNPLVISRRVGSGAVSTSLGAYVVLNDKWALTAGHIAELLRRLDEETEKSAEFRAKMAEIAADASLDKGKRKKRIRQAKHEYNPDDLATNFSYWCGRDGIQIGDIHVDSAVDLAVFQYQNAPDGWGAPYPFLRDGPFRPGVSVMKYGYPFHEVKARFDEQTSDFMLEDGIPVPVFPIEGICTRQAKVEPHDQYQRTMLETSSPGLRGQSGGPIVDQQGTVWAIQSITRHLALGFNPTVTRGNSSVEEHQFLNVGMGADAETIKGFLSHHQIVFNTR